MEFLHIENAIEDFAKGKIIIVVDDENRENEGDFIFAAEKVTPEHINFIIKEGRGLVCMPASEEMLRKMEIEMMVSDNSSLMDTPFTVSIDAVEGTTTGISAFERSHTVKKFVADDAKPEDFGKPGHIFPLKAKNGGVLQRAGHTEATVDLAKLAGLKPAGVLCEILNDDGTMARLPQLEVIAEKFGLHLITIKDLIEFRRRREKLVKCVVETVLPTEYGKFDLKAYETTIGNESHFALIKGDIKGKENVLVRVHSSCFTGDTLLSKRCDCGEQLHKAMQMINDEGCGVILYMQQEGRGIGLINKLHAYSLQDNGLDTVEANLKLGFKSDLRDYGIGAQILKDLGLTTIRLMTNNPKKIIGLKGFNLKVTERVPIEIEPNEMNLRYLSTKKDKMGHIMDNLGKKGQVEDE